MGFLVWYQKRNTMDHLLTESPSHYDHLELMNTGEILTAMNQEDQTVPQAVAKTIPQIEKIVDSIVARVQKGGRLLYIGAGTSGRLGVVDASECLPTFGVGDIVFAAIAGGDAALRNPIESAEDSENQAWNDLQSMFQVNEGDCVVGISASGRTPYVVGGLARAKENGLFTAAITCNDNSEMSKVAHETIAVIVGPEFLTGSTRLKSGTAQKLVLNMISTSLMIRLGKVRGNQMVDMRISNAKLVIRGTKMIADALQISSEDAKKLLLKHGSVRRAVDAYQADPEGAIADLE